MSEFINNREYRQKELKRLILKLHDGASVEDVREEFARMSDGVSATEIAAMEQALVREGMPVSDIQRLCDVHAAVFKGSIEQIHAYDSAGSDAASAAAASSSGPDGAPDDAPEGPGGYPHFHPVSVFRRENRWIESVIAERVLPDVIEYAAAPDDTSRRWLIESLDALATVDRHYARKEYLIFPIMEKYGITAPPQVMWGVDDEIRAGLRRIRTMLDEETVDASQLEALVRDAVGPVEEMIFKEENIMLPMIADLFQDSDWESIAAASPEIGYILTEPVEPWKAVAPTKEKAAQGSGAVTTDGRPGLAGYGEATESRGVEEDTAGLQPGEPGYAASGEVAFDAGSLLPEEINAILNTLPLDMTFVGADDRVKYFTQGKDRIFDRPRTILGREVKNCHPPKSVHVVEQIVADLRSGKKDHEDFWIRMGDRFVYIRYYAVRSSDGRFLGTLEVTQDIKPITELEGEKRLMS